MTQCYHIFSSQCFTCLFFLITFHQKNRITSQRINPQRRRSVNHIIRLTHLIIRKQCFFRGIYSISIIKINNFVTVISYIPPQTKQPIVCIQHFHIHSKFETSILKYSYITFQCSISSRRRNRNIQQRLFGTTVVPTRL